MGLQGSGHGSLLPFRLLLVVAAFLFEGHPCLEYNGPFAF